MKFICKINFEILNTAIKLFENKSWLFSWDWVSIWGSIYLCFFYLFHFIVAGHSTITVRRIHDDVHQGYAWALAMASGGRSESQKSGKPILLLAGVVWDHLCQWQDGAASRRLIASLASRRWRHEHVTSTAARISQQRVLTMILPWSMATWVFLARRFGSHTNGTQYCTAKPKGSNCLLFK